MMISIMPYNFQPWVRRRHQKVTISAQMFLHIVAKIKDVISSMKKPLKDKNDRIEGGG